MPEKDNEQTEPFTKQIDPFTSLMFGKGHDDESYGDRETKQNTQITANTINHFDNWIFGPKQKEKNSEKSTAQNQIEDFLNEIDFILLMETIDSIRNSSKQLKPLVKKLIPYLEKFKST
ncbi:hypothetical protein [Cytobacillus firmus]|uniref:hypothetical protein n=1 Tax=Cytobacillus firmus TaxID=1399 RepID=UPI002161405F|nr:hypothetical protein [Cytobacillus firmus]MCS0674528.1 hypothetical protein [Cytobacillus firmus]